MIARMFAPPHLAIDAGRNERGIRAASLDQLVGAGERERVKRQTIANRRLQHRLPAA